MGKQPGNRPLVSGSVSAGGYDASRFEPKAAPDFVYEIEVLSGPEGEDIDIEQARTIRDFLLTVRAKRLPGVLANDISTETEEMIDGNISL